MNKLILLAALCLLAACGVAPRKYIIPYNEGYKLPEALEQEL